MTMTALALTPDKNKPGKVINLNDVHELSRFNTGAKYLQDYPTVNQHRMLLHSYATDKFVDKICQDARHHELYSSSDEEEELQDAIGEAVYGKPTEEDFKAFKRVMEQKFKEQQELENKQKEQQNKRSSTEERIAEAIAEAEQMRAESEKAKTNKK